MFYHYTTTSLESGCTWRATGRGDVIIMVGMLTVCVWDKHTQYYPRAVSVAAVHMYSARVSRCSVNLKYIDYR